MNTHIQHQKRGFTLIELLVVIAIIAILAAILFPVFARARENARRASCMSNIKQISLGFMQYTQDFDERFPLALWEDPATINSSAGAAGHTFLQPSTLNTAMPSGVYKTSGGTGSANYYSWMDFIFPYVKSVQIFTCPSFTVKVASTQTDSPGYGYNVFISRLKGEGGSSFPSKAPASVSAIQRTSEIILTLDFPVVYGSGATPGNYCSTSSSGFLNPGSAYYPLMWPHLEGGTVAFADGHAKWYKRGSTSICRIASTSINTDQRAWDPLVP